MNAFYQIVSPVAPSWSAGDNIQNIPDFKISDIKISMKRTAFSANSASLIGAKMVDIEPMVHIGFKAFKVGAVTSLIALTLWAAALVADHVVVAIICAALGTVGATIMLAGVVEGRRREIHHGGR